MTTTDPSIQALQALDNGIVIGNDGDDIGRVGEVYTDNDTGQPSWVTVKTGWFGTNDSFVPLSSATIDGDTIRVPYDKDMIKGAPNYDAGAPLSETDEQDLYAYYGLGSYSDGVDSDGSTDQARARLDTTGTAGTDTEISPQANGRSTGSTSPGRRSSCTSAPSGWRPAARGSGRSSSPSSRP